jgi:hypothetical protein
MEGYTQLLIRHGFRESGTCRCDGYFTKKYRKRNIEIKIRVSKYTFKVKEDNSTLYGFQALINLEKVLNELDKKTV